MAKTTFYAKSSRSAFAAMRRESKRKRV